MAMLLSGVLASPALGQDAAASTAPVAGAAFPPSVPVSTAAPVLLPGIPPLSPLSGVAQPLSPAAPPPAPGQVPRPWVIGDIAVEGNKNVKPGTIRSQVKARKGSLYDRPELDRDVQALLGMGNFERVAADVSLLDKPVPAHFAKVAGADRQARLTFLVKEKPLVKKLRFNGNKKLSRSALDDATVLKAKDPLDEAKLREDQRKILDKYREKGFLDAQARYEVKRDTAALQAEVDWFITEGPKSYITEVVLSGAKAFKTKKLLKLMKNRAKAWFRAGAYSEKDLPDDIKKISDHYRNRGYLDVLISTPTVKFSPDKTRISISMDLLEGRAYKFGDTSFSGHIIFTSTELAHALEYRRGRIFNQEKFDASLRSIQELYADKGRLRARLTPVKTLNPKTDLMDMAVAIVEGDIVYIDHVDLEGNKATKTHVLKREVTVKPGQAFSLSRIKKSRERIMNLGFIDDVDVDIQPTPDPEKVDLTFDVIEGKPGMLTAGAAYSSIDGLIGTLSLQHMNLFGRAQRASLQWSFGRRVQDYSASWMTPWVYNKPVSFGLDAFNTRRISPYSTSLSAYVQKRTGGTVRLGPRFQEDKYHLNLSYTFSRVSIENVESAFLDTLSPGASIYSSLTAEFARDTRDNIWDPSHGTRHAFGAALTGGPLFGDVHFVKPWLSNAGYWTLCKVGDEDWPVVLGASNRTSYVTQFGETKDVPVFERFFIGGQDTLRGYNATGEAGFPTGGKVYDILNIEIGVPLARERKKTIVKIVGFFDMGGSWDRAKDISGRIGSGVRDIKTDAGVGIRFVTPAFPIRLDWGYGFNHRPGERLYQINFGMGNLF